MDLPVSPIRFVIIGQLRKSFIVLPNNEFIQNQPGGNALYAAVGAAVWEKDIGIVARVSHDYPEEWLEKIKGWNFDIRGVQRVEDTIDHRELIVYQNSSFEEDENLEVFLNSLNRPFPRELIGYKASTNSLDSRNKPGPFTIRSHEVPAEYLDASAVHVCSIDFLSHLLLPANLRQGQINTISLDTGKGYMDPAFWDDLPLMVNGLTVFHTSEKNISRLFSGKTDNLWEMAESIAAMGCEFVVIRRGAQGQYLFETASRKKWVIPAYPSNVRCPAGAGDAFCGGFLVGYYTTYDPVQAALQGSISSSLVVEGTDPFYALDALPGLAKARLEILKERVRQI
jgi:sugar/nucleoside kinase (ribokinase family)